MKPSPSLLVNGSVRGMKGKAQQGGFSAGRGKKKREELVGDEGGLESLAHRIH